MFTALVTVTRKYVLTTALTTVGDWVQIPTGMSESAVFKKFMTDAACNEGGN